MSKKLSDFRELEENPNAHTERGMSMLEDSIQAVGYTEPMVAAADGEMLSGSARLETAAEVFGPDVEPIVVESDGTRPIIHVRTDIPSSDDPKAKKIIWGSNRIAEVNFAIDLEVLEAAMSTGEPALDGLYTPAELAAILRKAQSLQDDGKSDDGDERKRLVIEEAMQRWSPELGDVFLVPSKTRKGGVHRLMVGDSTDGSAVAFLLDRHVPNICITDPPYNVGLDYGGDGQVNDNMDIGEYVSWSQRWLAHVPEPLVLSVGIKRLLWWHQIKPNPQWIIAWIKYNGVSQTGFLGPNKWDAILCYNVVRDRDSDIAVFNADYNTVITGDARFPAGKSLDLWEYLIRRFSSPKAEIYEPFSGSGTTLVAAEKTSRICYAMEIVPETVAISLSRMAENGLEPRKE